MERNNIINELWRLAKPSPEKCAGCGQENRCSISGCAIIRAAVQEIESLNSLEKVFYRNQKAQEEPDTLRREE